MSITSVSALAHLLEEWRVDQKHDPKNYKNIQNNTIINKNIILEMEFLIF